MAIKCIALDLDRTTLNSDGKISKANRMAIEEAIDKGIHVIIASGRAFDTLPEDILSISGIEYAVTSNGAAMYNVPEKRCMAKTYLPEMAVRKIFSFTNGLPVAREVFIDGVAYGGCDYVENPVKYGATEEAISYIKNTRKPVEDIEAFAMEHIKELECMDIILGDECLSESIKVYIKQNVEGVYLTTSFKQLLEISNKDAGKHSGVRYFMELLGLAREEIAAFGDADNDVDMLRFVGHGVAVENASDQCRQVAKYITKHHNEDAIAYALKELLKI